MPLSPTPQNVSPRSRIFQRAGKHGTALAFMLGGALMLAPAASWVLPAPAAMAQDDGSGEAGQQATGTEVIAQGVTKLPKGNIAWLINKDAVPGGEGAAVSSFPLGFGLTDAGAVEVRDEDGSTLSVLNRGEGFFLPSGKGGSLVSRTADDADFFVILLVSGEAATDGSLPGTVVGEPFAAPETRDVELELRRGVLRNDDQAVIPASAAQTPSLMLVTSGTAQLTGPDGQPVALGVGQFALLAGGVTVGSADGSPAEFVVASIGDSVTAGKSAGDGEGQGQGRTRTRTNNAGATAAGNSSGGRGGGGGGGGGRAAGGTGGGGGQQGGGQQGGATTDGEGTPTPDQSEQDREARRAAREARQNQNAGTPTPVNEGQDVTPATPSPVPDDTADDTVDETEDEDIVIVDQDDTEVDDTDEQDASDPNGDDGDTQVIEVPAPDDGTTDTTDPADTTEPETPVEEVPVTEDPVVEQPTGDEAAPEDTQPADPNAVTEDPVVEQSDATEEIVVEQTTPEEVVVEQTAPEEVVVEQTAPEVDPATSTDETAPAEGATTP